MDTINNMATAAAKAVWGENQTQQREPISGATGDVSKGEPYDAGNLETPYQERMENTLGASSETAPTTTTTNTNTNANTNINTNPATTTSTEPPAAARPSETHEVAPSRTENAAYASTEDAETQNKQEEGILDQSELKGSGPRPLEVVAKENGGNASAPTSSSSDNNGRSENLGNANSGEDSLTESTGQGTGEQYVKTSGLAADGGDFDATNPGAGREADRLLEEKGVHRDEGDANKTSASPDGHKDKPSLGQRIKAKLHKH